MTWATFRSMFGLSYGAFVLDLEAGMRQTDKRSDGQNAVGNVASCG